MVGPSTSSTHRWCGYSSRRKVTWICIIGEFVGRLICNNSGHYDVIYKALPNTIEVRSVVKLPPAPLTHAYGFLPSEAADWGLAADDPLLLYLPPAVTHSSVSCMPVTDDLNVLPNTSSAHWSDQPPSTSLPGQAQSASHMADSFITTLPHRNATSGHTSSPSRQLFPQASTSYSQANGSDSPVASVAKHGEARQSQGIESQTAEEGKFPMSKGNFE